MSTGITIECEPPQEEFSGGYFQNIATEFENLYLERKGEPLDLAPFLYCPESYEDSEEMRLMGASDVEVGYNQTINRDDFHPIDAVHTAVRQSIRKFQQLDASLFWTEKESVMSDLETIESILAAQDGEVPEGRRRVATGATRGS